MGGKKASKSIYYSFKLLLYVIRYAKQLLLWEITWVFLKIVKTIFVDIYLLTYIIDAVVNGIDFFSACRFVIFCVILAFAEMYIQDWINQYIRPVAKSKLHLSVQKTIFDKIRQTDIRYFDDTEFYNDYIWVLDRTEDQILSTFESYKQLLLSVLTILVIVIFLSAINPIAIIFSIIPMIFVAVIGPILNKKDYNCDKILNPFERKSKYSERVFYLKQNAEDIRVTHIGKAILENFEDSINNKIRIQKDFGRRKFYLLAIQDGSYGFVQMLGLYLFLLYQAIVVKSFSVGLCTAILNSVDRLSGYFYQLSLALLSIQKNALFSEKFFSFMNNRNNIEKDTSIDSQLNSEALSSMKNICVKDVTFSYPNNPELVLDGLNFQIQQGEKIAIVGENGAGKTTLIKLLLRLYDPLCGEILYNNKNIRDIDIALYRNKYSTVFQSPQLYATRYVENIIMDKFREDDTLTYTNVQSCLNKAGVNVKERDLLKNVTKEYDPDGMEFSVGQKQKVAIARALFSNGEIILMDEASAALDPLSEKEINDMLLKEFKNKTIIIITHRLTTVKNVDKILFLEKGRIIEAGTHNELMLQKGKYYELYNAQAESYRD